MTLHIADMRETEFTEARLEDALLNSGEQCEIKSYYADLIGADSDDVAGVQPAKARNTTCPDGGLRDNCYTDGAWWGLS